LRRGIEGTGCLPAGESKDRSELDFQLVLGPCLIATHGPAASTAVATFARARELCERLGEPPEDLQGMFWLATVSVVRGELPQALEAVAALLSAAEARGDRPALINATRGRAMILFFLGRIVEAREAIERAVEIFSVSQEVDRVAARAAGQDAGVAMLALMSWVLWALGQVDEAVARMGAALERADAVQHAHTHAYAWYYASVLHTLRGEATIAQAYAERCLAISEQHGFRQWLGLSRAIRGICAAVLDASGSRFDEVKAALDEYQRAGYQLGITAQVVLVCAALLFRNEAEAALELIDHGFSIVSRNSERCFEAELYRLKAHALLMRGASDAEAESLLDQALRIARSQQARSLELRAATDLARLWMRQGKHAEALDGLASIHGRFTEGFDTRDVKEATDVLAQLQSCYLLHVVVSAVTRRCSLSGTSFRFRTIQICPKDLPATLRQFDRGVDRKRKFRHETAPFHHVARRRGDCVAVCGAGAVTRPGGGHRRADERGRRRSGGVGSRKRTRDWLGGHAGGYLLQHSAKKRIFVIAITPLAHRRR